MFEKQQFSALYSLYFAVLYNVVPLITFSCTKLIASLVGMLLTTAYALPNAITNPLNHDTSQSIDMGSQFNELPTEPVDGEPDQAAINNELIEILLQGSLGEQPFITIDDKAVITPDYCVNSKSKDMNIYYCFINKPEQEDLIKLKNHINEDQKVSEELTKKELPLATTEFTTDGIDLELCRESGNEKFKIYVCFDQVLLNDFKSKLDAEKEKDKRNS